MNWEQFEKQIDGTLRKYMRTYREGIRKQLEEAGYKKVPFTRVRASREVRSKFVSPDRHLRWLVRWRVPDPTTGKTWSKQRIAAEDGVSWRTVKEALNRTAALLG